MQGRYLNVIILVQGATTRDGNLQRQGGRLLEQGKDGEGRKSEREHNAY